jgi:hypothetical protein
MLARLTMVFVVSALGAMSIEILLWRWESLLSFVFPFAIFVLVSLRFLPWRTPTRKAFSGGIFVGVFLPLIIFSFGYSF